MKKKLLYLMMFGTVVCLLVLADSPQSLVNHELNLAYAGITTEVGQSRIWKAGFFKSDKPGTTSTLERLWIAPMIHPKHPRRPKHSVPEPSTMALMGTGVLSGLGIYLFSKYRNRKK